jgi:TonB family protein
MTSANTFPRTPSVAGGPGRGMLSLLLGAGFTFVIFLGMARFDRTEPAEPPADIMDLRAVSIQEPPPPPRETPREAVPVETTLTGFDPAPSESPVQITITPPDLEALLPPPSLAPPAVIQTGRLYTDLRPKMELSTAADHIFQMAEVDQVPKVLNRVAPTIPSSVRKGAVTLRASLLFVVDASGEIRNVRLASSSGNPEFDAIILGNIKEWTFSPAVRKGKKVRCLLQQAVIIQWSGGSRFEI